jgi:hypothetical protein
MSARGAVRRIKGATSRVENQPYDFMPETRQPRLGGGVGYGYCQLGATLAAATGTWPSITPQTVTGVTVYRPQNASSPALASVVSNAKVYNWRNVSWDASKTSLVLLNSVGGWDIIDQDC